MRLPPIRAATMAPLLLALPTLAVAQDAAYVPPADELAEAEGIIAVMFPPAEREQIMLGMASAVAGQAAAGMMSGPIFEEPGIRAIMDRFLADLPDTLQPIFAKHLPLIVEATAVAYTREFSLEELRDISAFARTPAGQRYFLNLQKLQNDPAVAAANQAMFADLAPLSQAEAEKVRGEVMEYLTANPDVLERLVEAEAGKEG